MCKSQSEGGQRCASNTRDKFFSTGQALIAAQAGGNATETAAAQQIWEDAAAQYASTPEGQHAMTSLGWILDAEQKWDESALYLSLAARGERIAEANRTAAEAMGARSTPAPAAGVHEGDEVGEYLRQMRRSGFECAFVFDDDEVEVDRIVLCRDEQEMLAMVEHYPSKYAARVRRHDGTWPPKTRALKMSEPIGTPAIIR
jgi:hypothetical protein